MNIHETGLKRAAAPQSREFAFTDDDYYKIVEYIKAAAGIVLAEGKREMVYGRLVRRLRALGCPDFTSYLKLLDGPDAKAEQTILINSLTTNLTGFFREEHHFTYLAKTILPELRAQGSQDRLRIWSAGCSSGQEPYSIAMTLRDALPDIDQWDALILATDIDSNMVAHGRAGLYDVEACRTIPASFAKRFVLREEDGQRAMSPALQKLIRFKRLNLLEPWPMKGQFDVIFCRNVVIYFDKETQRVLFNRYAEILRPNGWLIIGHSESLTRLTDRFANLGQTIYRKIK